MKYNIENKPVKIILFLFFTTIFTFLYSLFDDFNFTGLNKVTEVIKDEIIKEEVKDKVKEEVVENIDEQKKDIIKINKNFEGYQPYISSDIYNKKVEKNKAIDDSTELIDIEVENNELSKEKIKPSFYTRIFNRLYFSISTGGLLGYGDVYPKSNFIKAISMIQVFSTICLIVF